MSTEIVRHSIGEIESMAEAVAKSRLFPGVENAQSAMVLMLLCESEGLHPIQAMRRFHIIEGRPSMRADAMQAEFQRHGGRVEWLSSTREECRAVFSHPQHAPKGFEVLVTFEELDQAGVTRSKYGVKDNWRKYPRQMLRARAVSEGVRAVDPGIVVGIYTPEEISDFDPRDVAIETTARVVEEPKPTPAAKENAEKLSYEEAVEQGRRHVLGYDEDGDLDDREYQQKAAVTSRFAKPTPAARKAAKVAEGLAEQFNSTRPQDRHEPIVQTAAALAESSTPSYDARPFTAVITEACRRVNEWLDDACEEKGIQHDPVLNVHQVMNHLTTDAIDRGFIKAEQVQKDGVRTRGLVNAFLANWYGSAEEDFAAEVMEYGYNKLKEACSKHGVLFNAAGIFSDGDGEPEGESQESGDVLDVEFTEA
jgi:hypothetical protein